MDVWIAFLEPEDEPYNLEVHAHEDGAIERGFDHIQSVNLLDRDELTVERLSSSITHILTEEDPHHARVLILRVPVNNVRGGIQ